VKPKQRARRHMDHNGRALCEEEVIHTIVYRWSNVNCHNCTALKPKGAR
jgi:hypothetical protein